MVGEGLNIVTSPAAWHVEPLVSSPFSSEQDVRPPGLGQMQQGRCTR